jgi:hypothetical protein
VLPGASPQPSSEDSGTGHMRLRIEPKRGKVRVLVPVPNAFIQRASRHASRQSVTGAVNEGSVCTALHCAAHMTHTPWCRGPTWHATSPTRRRPAAPRPVCGDNVGGVGGVRLAPMLLVVVIAGVGGLEGAAEPVACKRTASRLRACACGTPAAPRPNQRAARSHFHHAVRLLQVLPPWLPLALSLGGGLRAAHGAPTSFCADNLPPNGLCWCAPCLP